MDLRPAISASRDLFKLRSRNMSIKVNNFTVTFTDLLRTSSLVCSKLIFSAGHYWEVRIYPLVSSTSKSLFGCYLVKRSSQGVTASFALQFRKAGGELFARATMQTRYFGANNIHSEFQLRNNMWGCTNCTLPATITITVQLIVNDSQRFIKEESVSDFTILVGDVSIHVNKGVLADRSPVLKAMLQARMLESATGKLRITSDDAAAVQEFVRFLKTGKCAVTSNAESLLALADFYEVPELQRLCENHLQAELSDANLLHVLHLAEWYKSVDLKLHVMSYITENASALLRSGTFLQCLTLEQCQEVLCAVARVDYTEAVPLE
jgi:hypothetical protein